MAEGASFEEITNYVRSNMRLTEAEASLHVAEVLVKSIALGKIIQTQTGKYKLTERKPPGLVCKIKEMKTSDDSDDSD